jgi:hypothetical protein
MSANINTRRRVVSTLAAAVSALAIAPGIAAASTTWFGSSLDHMPANSGNSCADFGVQAGTCTHVGSDYPGFSGHAQAPASGTITALKLIPAGPMTFTFEVVKTHVASDFQSGRAQAVQRSRQITVQGPTQDQMDNGDYPTVTVPVHLNVKKGQELAINTSSNTAEYCSDGTPGQLLFSPLLVAGHGFQNSSGVDDCLMLVQAVMHH